MAALSVTTVNYLLQGIMRRFSDMERHETQTKLNVSVAFKLTVARFLNSSLVIVLVNWDNAKNWYNGGNLVYDASILIVLLTFQPPLFYLMDFPGLMKKFRIWTEKKKEGDCQLTQQEANVLCEGSAVDTANNISNYMNLIMTCIFYSPLIPQAIPMALIGSFINYWVYKYMLLRKHTMPDMFSKTMATFFANLIPHMAFIWAVSFTVLIDRQYFEYAQNLAGDLKNKAKATAAATVISDQAVTYAYVSLVLACCCLLMPWRLLMGKCIDEDTALEDQTLYRDKALYFSTDYDKANPLTSQKGQLRLLDLQIEKEEREGGQDGNKNLDLLRQQREAVSH